MDSDQSQSIDVILNQWSLGIQVSIILVFVLVFLALWFYASRRITLIWLSAWSLNALALLAVNAVLMGTDKMPDWALSVFYSIYAYAKIGFSMLLVTGLRVFSRQQPLLLNHAVRAIFILAPMYLIALIWMHPNLLIIQISVYWIVGLILLVAALMLMFRPIKFHIKAIILIFLIEGVIFIHHAWVLMPALFGEAVPRYMTRISFFDSIAELAVGISCLLTVALLVIDEIRQRNQELEDSQKALRELVDIDPLTGLYNRRHLEAYQDSINSDCALIFIDVDHFKRINDRWGHAAGDLCLKRIATSMRQHFGITDGLFRLGGDEFLIIIPSESQSNMDVRLTEMQQELKLQTAGMPAVSISIGIFQHDQSNSFDLALVQADANMYAAKEAGRGSIIHG